MAPTACEVAGVLVVLTAGALGEVGVTAVAGTSETAGSAPGVLSILLPHAPQKRELGVAGAPHVGHVAAIGIIAPHTRQSCTD